MNWYFIPPVVLSLLAIVASWRVFQHRCGSFKWVAFFTCLNLINIAVNSIIVTLGTDLWYYRSGLSSSIGISLLLLTVLFIMVGVEDGRC